MKYLILCLAALIFASCETQNQTPTQEKGTLARITTYWPSEDRQTRLHKSATGERLHEGSAAVDPRKIPYGSRILLEGSTLTAVDTGRDVRNRKAARLSGRTPEEKSAQVVDVFFESKARAMRWASSHDLFQRLQIIEP
jgi:3D (Asp-Asp-Asp) domain-containing protein